MVHIYNGMLTIKKSKIMPTATTWMDLETAILSEVSQTQKDKCHVISLMWNLKSKQNRSRVTDVENKTMVTRE